MYYNRPKGFARTIQNCRVENKKCVALTRMLFNPNPLPPGEGGREDRMPMEGVAALEFHYSGMRQRHDLVQTAAMVGFGHLGVAQVGTRDTSLGVRPGV